MNASHRLLAAVALAGSLIISPARSASYSTDQSDLWWIPDESGWGIQFVQRSNLIFATMFVYDSSGNPTWYVAVMVANELTWSGDLYSTRGPWFGTVPFDPAAVQATKAGSMSWSPSQVNAGTLTYTVNGIEVTKELQRQFIAVDDFSGDYGGNLHQVNTGCLNAVQNGTNDLAAVLQISQTGSSIMVLTGDENLNVCVYTGTLSQSGQMGSVAGTFTCSGGDHGNFNMNELQVNPIGITVRLTADATPSGCAESAWFGGGRGTTF